MPNLMPNFMKAAVLRALAEPLSVEELPVPTPGAGEVLVKVVACGVCHSDLHLARGEWDLLKPITKLPLAISVLVLRCALRGTELAEG